MRTRHQTVPCCPGPRLKQVMGCGQSFSCVGSIHHMRNLLQKSTLTSPAADTSYVTRLVCNFPAPSHYSFLACPFGPSPLALYGNCRPATILLMLHRAHCQGVSPLPTRNAMQRTALAVSFAVILDPGTQDSQSPAPYLSQPGSISFY